MARARARPRKKVTRKKVTRRRASTSRKRLTPRKEKRGLSAHEIPLEPDSAALSALRSRVESAGGVVLAAYRDPFSGRPLLLATLPIRAVAPTPFQRDLSPAHTKRLAEKIEESGCYLDPLIVVEGSDGGLWTPNGRHRLAAARLLGLEQITALISPDEALAFRILALNTEKAHNLKDRSLEVIRMARELARRRPRARERDFAAELESPALLTLGLLYERSKRFAGSAYHPFLRKVDHFSIRTLPAGLREREGWAARLEAIDAEVQRVIAGLKRRGFRSPYLRNLVVARINPLRFQRIPRTGKTDGKPPMTMAAALTRMAAAARRFEPDKVRESDLALVAALSSEDVA
ncbi:MAG: ParB N-terminal domain-containing protein [Myxococcota bacterium]